MDKRTASSNLIKLVDELAWRGRSNASDLAPDEIGEVIAFLIEIDGIADEFCCLTESKHSDRIIHLFKKFMASELMGDGVELSEAMRESAVDFYWDRVDDLIKDAHSLISNDMYSLANKNFFDPDFQERKKCMQENL